MTTEQATKPDYSKTNWSCVNDIISGAVCTGIPEWEIAPHETKLEKEVRSIYSLGTCKLDPKTCGKYKSSKQIWDELSQEEKDRVTKPVYKETKTLTGGPKDTTKEKPKTKAAKKLENEIAQRSMF